MLKISEWDTKETPTELEIIQSIKCVLDQNDPGGAYNSEFNHNSFKWLLPKIPMLYRYAFEGRVMLDGDQTWEGLFTDAVQDLIAVVALQRCLYDFLRELENFEVNPVPAEMLLIAIIARIKLDSYLKVGYIDIDDCPPVGMIPRYSDLPGLTRKELAVLAKLSERSVQNDTTESQGRRLKLETTTMADYGNQVEMRFAPFSEAKAYLDGKKRYQPTQRNTSNIEETIFAK